MLAHCPRGLLAGAHQLGAQRGHLVRVHLRSRVRGGSSSGCLARQVLRETERGRQHSIKGDGRCDGRCAALRRAAYAGSAFEAHAARSMGGCKAALRSAAWVWHALTPPDAPLRTSLSLRVSSRSCAFAVVPPRPEPLPSTVHSSALRVPSAAAVPASTNHRLHLSIQVPPLWPLLARAGPPPCTPAPTQSSLSLPNAYLSNLRQPLPASQTAAFASAFAASAAASMAIAAAEPPQPKAQASPKLPTESEFDLLGGWQEKELLQLLGGGSSDLELVKELDEVVTSDVESAFMEHATSPLV